MCLINCLPFINIGTLSFFSIPVKPFLIIDLELGEYTNINYSYQCAGNIKLSYSYMQIYVVQNSKKTAKLCND